MYMYISMYRYNVYTTRALHLVRPRQMFMYIYLYISLSIYMYMYISMCIYNVYIDIYTYIHIDIYIYIHTYICIHMYIYGPGTSKAHAPHPGRVSTRDWTGSVPSLRRSSNSLELGGRQLLSQPLRARLPRQCPAEVASRERERAERERARGGERGFFIEERKRAPFAQGSGLNTRLECHDTPRVRTTVDSHKVHTAVSRQRLKE